MSVYVNARRIRTRNAILGFAALALAVGAVALTWFFLKGGLSGGVPVKAVFSAPGVGQQLPIGGDVKVRGVLVGRIQDITLDDEGRAIIHLRLNTTEHIPESSRAEIRSKTIFGQKWVELLPPPAATNQDFLVAGSVIPDERTLEPLELERALQLGHNLLDEIPFQDLSRALTALARGFTGQEDDAVKAIDNGLIALRAINDKADKFDLSIRQLREFSEFLDTNDDTVLDFFTALDSANRALIGAAPEFRRSLDSFPTFLNRFTSYQKRINGDLGELIEDGATLTEILSARSDDIVDMFVQLEAFATVWNSGLKQPCAGAFESDMTCWQVYQMPGLDSRGLYASGESPLANEPNDPLYGTATASVPNPAALHKRKAGKSDLARILALPLVDPFTDQSGVP